MVVINLLKLVTMLTR